MQNQDCLLASSFWSSSARVKRNWRVACLRVIHGYFNLFGILFYWGKNGSQCEACGLAGWCRYQYHFPGKKSLWRASGRLMTAVCRAGMPKGRRECSFWPWGGSPTQHLRIWWSTSLLPWSSRWRILPLRIFLYFPGTSRWWTRARIVLRDLHSWVPTI